MNEMGISTAMVAEPDAVGWRFDNTYARLPEALFAPATPARVRSPRVSVLNHRLADVGPMLREYVVSEAMAALGIPTTRSLAVVTTDDPVYRETVRRGAILTRVAASHIRVGTFEYAARRGEPTLRALADYAIERH